MTIGNTNLTVTNAVRDAGLCIVCLAQKAGVAPLRVLTALAVIGQRATLTDGVARCDGCLRTTVVHRLVQGPLAAAYFEPGGCRPFERARAVRDAAERLGHAGRPKSGAIDAESNVEMMRAFGEPAINRPTAAMRAQSGVFGTAFSMPVMAIGLLDETELLVENRRVVVVEADDHADHPGIPAAWMRWTDSEGIGCAPTLRQRIQVHPANDCRQFRTSTQRRAVETTASTLSDIVAARGFKNSGSAGDPRRFGVYRRSG